MILEPNHHWYELMIEGYPAEPLENLVDLKSRLGLSQAFLQPGIREHLMPAIVRSNESPDRNDAYWTFLQLESGDEPTVIIVYAQIYLSIVEIFQKERNLPLEIPIEVFQDTLREEFRGVILGLLAKCGDDNEEDD